MNKKRYLTQKYWSSFGESYGCSESKHKDGNCFACNIMNVCFKKSKILFLKSKGYSLKYMAVLKPVVFSHKQRRKNEEMWGSLLNRKFEYKSFEDFKIQTINISKALCQMNNGIRAISRNYELDISTKDLYYYFIKKIGEKDHLITLHFLFVNHQFESAILVEEEDNDCNEEILEEETMEIIKINKKRIRLGLDSITRRKIYKRDNYTCRYCGWRNGLPNQMDKPLSIDHIIPKGLGGTSKDENLVTCCLDCNISKNDKFLPSILKNWIWNPKEVVNDKQIISELQGEAQIKETK